MEAVAAFLQEIGLGQYIPSFQANGFEDLDVVAAMDDKDCDACGLLPGHRKKLMLAAGRLVRGQPPSRSTIAPHYAPERTAGLPSPSSFSGGDASTRRPFGGASYAPRGSATATFAAPADDGLPPAGVERALQETATEHLARGGSGVHTVGAAPVTGRRAMLNPNLVPPHAAYAVNAANTRAAGVSRSLQDRATEELAGGGGFSARGAGRSQIPQGGGGGGGYEPSFGQRIQERPREIDVNSTRTDVDLNATVNLSARRQQTMQEEQEDQRRQQQQQVQQKQQFSSTGPLPRSTHEDPPGLAGTGRFGGGGQLNATAPALSSTARERERERVRFAATPDLVQVEPERPARGLAAIAVAAPGTVDPKSNFTSSDNPLAWTGGVSRGAAAASLAAHPVLPASKVRALEGAPAAGPAPTTARRGLNPPAATAPSFGGVHRGAPQASAQAGPLAEPYGTHGYSFDTSRARPNIATAAPGTVDMKSNLSSSDNPLANPVETRIARPTGSEEFVKFAAAPGEAPASSNVASADNPLVPVIKLGGGAPKVTTYRAKPKATWGGKAAPSAQQQDPYDEVEYVKFAAPPGSASAASNIASADNPLVF